MSTPDQTTGVSENRQAWWRLDSFALGRSFAIATAVLFAVVWGPLFSRSLWLDEAGTFWMAHEGPIRAIQKTLHWPGQSLLFAAISSFFCFDGSPLRDVLLRIPSLIGIIAASYFIYRIAERRIGNHAGMAAVVLFVFHPDVTMTGHQARPYALGMAAVAASYWALSEWEISRRRSHLAAYITASILIIYLHYFFAVILLAQALYLMFVFFVQGRRQRWHEIVIAPACILLSVVPLVPHLRLTIGQRGTLSYLARPLLSDLAVTLAPSVLVAGLMASGCLLAFVLPARFRRRTRPDSAFLCLLTAWWLAGPVLLIAVSKATPIQVFIPRYLASSLPAQALLFTWLGYTLFGAAGARVWAFAAAVLFFANPVMALRHGGWGEELAPLMRLIRAEPGAPVFFPSLLPESPFYDWRAGNRPDSYLFAPLVAYPIDNPVLPLPIAPTDEVREYIGEIVDLRLKGASEVLFVEHYETWEPWILERMQRAGFHVTVRPAGSFKLFVFRR